MLHHTTQGPCGEGEVSCRVHVCEVYHVGTVRRASATAHARRPPRAASRACSNKRFNAERRKRNAIGRGPRRGESSPLRAPREMPKKSKIGSQFIYFKFLKDLPNVFLRVCTERREPRVQHMRTCLHLVYI